MWRNLFTVSWKNEVFQCTVDENKIDICAFCLYRSNFCHFKKSLYFYLYQDMSHDEKSCETTRIENHRALILLIYPTKPTEYLLSIKILHSNPFVVTQACLRIFLINNSTQQENHASCLALCTFMR